jgi:hypothetical protein
MGEEDATAHAGVLHEALRPLRRDARAMDARHLFKNPLIIGWREWVSLPDLKVDAVKAKIDTGARTSALHAFRIEPFRHEDEAWVRFELHPLQRSRAMQVTSEARVIDERSVRSSNGRMDRRYIIKTLLRLGDVAWPIELSLANRDEMGFRMLLGRTALRGRTVIEPGRSFLLGAAAARLAHRHRPAARRPRTA